MVSIYHGFGSLSTKNLAEAVRFELTVGYQPTLVFKTSAIIHLGHTSKTCRLFLFHSSRYGVNIPWIRRYVNRKMAGSGLSRSPYLSVPAAFEAVPARLSGSLPKTCRLFLFLGTTVNPRNHAACARFSTKLLSLAFVSFELI